MGILCQYLCEQCAYFVEGNGCFCVRKETVDREMPFTLHVCLYTYLYTHLLSLSLSLTHQKHPEPSTEESLPPPATLPEDITHRSLSGVTHRLTPLINEKTSQYARYIFEPVDSTNWSVVHEDGEMKVHRREMEEDGVVIDPLRATYTVNVSVLTFLSV